jgi:hypothetical protein
LAAVDRILLDTGPLLTLFTFSYLRNVEAEPAHYRSVLVDVRRGNLLEDFEDRFRQLLGRSRLATSSHVLAEAFRLRNQSRLKADEYRFRRLAVDELKKANIEELHCPASDLSLSKASMNWACLLGLTDATLLHIAMERDYIVLSDDHRLRDSGSGYVQLLDTLVAG